MQLSFHQDGDVMVYTVAGRLDAYTAPKLRDRLIMSVERGNVRLVVDLAQVAFMDSSGMAALVAARKHAQNAGGDLFLAGLKPHVGVILKLTHLDAAFRIAQDVPQALQEMRAN